MQRQTTSAESAIQGEMMQGCHVVRALKRVFSAYSSIRRKSWGAAPGWDESAPLALADNARMRTGDAGLAAGTEPAKQDAEKHVEPSTHGKTSLLRSA
ncbi:MAG: hypothetical protein DME97_11335 [Verrucomicrobia bacterium]|nr:MAG: hypothetical protein DME97_11335 [Verrucomicrobiota bacterium]